MPVTFRESRGRPTFPRICDSARCRSAVLSLLHGNAGRKARAGAEIWLSELIWRDFSFMSCITTRRWSRSRSSRNTTTFAGRTTTRSLPRGARGRTGYPIVDAAMRQLNQTGYMHNRLRMIAASFLTKDLLVDWRWENATSPTN